MQQIMQQNILLLFVSSTRGYAEYLAEEMKDRYGILAMKSAPCAAIRDGSIETFATLLDRIFAGVRNIVFTADAFDGWGISLADVVKTARKRAPQARILVIRPEESHEWQKPIPEISLRQAGVHAVFHDKENGEKLFPWIKTLLEVVHAPQQPVAKQPAFVPRIQVAKTGHRDSLHAIKKQGKCFLKGDGGGALHVVLPRRFYKVDSGESRLLHNAARA